MIIYMSKFIYIWIKVTNYTVGWGLTSKCNMKCKFCYSWRYRKNSVAHDEITLDDAIRFIDLNYNEIKDINYGTGENTLLDFFYPLLKYIGDTYQINQGLTTNGYLSNMLNNRYKKKIISDHIVDLDVSLDHWKSTSHNFIRGHSNAYKWAIDSIKFGYDSSMNVSIVTCLSKLNAKVENLLNLLDVARKYDSFLRINIYRPLNNKFELCIDIPLLYDILKSVFKKADNIYVSDPLFSSLLNFDIPQEDTKDRSLRILPKGEITPSTYLITPDWYATSIKDNPVKLSNKIMTKPPFLKYDHAPIPHVCNNCIYLKVCRGGAKDRRWLWYQDFKAKDPLCPFEYYDNNPFENIEYNINPVNLIHLRYLPTIVMT